jgi:hypothetical protein
MGRRMGGIPDQASFLRSVMLTSAWDKHSTNLCLLLVRSDLSRASEALDWGFKEVVCGEEDLIWKCWVKCSGSSNTLSTSGLMVDLLGPAFKESERSFESPRSLLMTVQGVCGGYELGF